MTKTTLITIALSSALVACAAPERQETSTQINDYDDGAVEVITFDTGDVLATVTAVDGTELSELEWFAEANSGVLRVHGADQSGAVEFAKSPSTTQISEMAYALTLAQTGDEAAKEIGCHTGGCCWAGIAGVGCEICWGSNGYWDARCFTY
jgi:hypothetical protein